MIHPAPTAKTAAFFDVDGTLIHATIVDYYTFFQRRRLTPLRFALWKPLFLTRCAGYLALDKVNRGLLNKIFYRNYAGLDVSPIREGAQECVRAIAEPNWLDGSRDEMRKHRLAGRAIVLVTGSLDFLMDPLARDLGGAAVLGARLEENNGTFTGNLVGGPVVGEEKRRRMLDYAGRHQIDMSQSHAYGDSSADLPMLEAVGFPHAVNPDRNLRRIARRRGWPIHQWRRERSLP